MLQEQSAPVNQAGAGTLYIISTPIGNDDDITLRAIRMLKHCDTVACEETKVGAKILKKLNISSPIIEVNEHTEQYANDEVIAKLIAGENVALISDCGTPLFADPGQGLLKRAFAANLPVVIVPGVTSIMTAIVRSGLSSESFIYAGFLSRKPEERREQLRALASEIRTLVFLETPYRVVPLLSAIAEIIPARRVYVGCNLTMPFETHHYGTVAEVSEKLMAEKFKGEAVICIEGAASEIRGGLRRKKASISSHYSDNTISYNEETEVGEIDESMSFNPDEEGFPAMRSSHNNRPINDDNANELDENNDDIENKDIKNSNEDIENDLENDFDLNFDEIEDDLEEETHKRGPTKPRFDNKPRPGYERPRFGGGDDRGERRPRFGGGDDRGERRPRFGGGDDRGERRPRFGGGDDRGERRPRFGGGDDRGERRPRFGGGDDRGERRPRFGGGDDRGERRPRFGGGDDRGERRPRFGGGDDRGERRPRFGGDDRGDRKPRFGGGANKFGGGKFGGGKPKNGGKFGGGKKFGGRRP